MSGVDFDGRRLRKGATEAIVQFVIEQGGEVPPELQEMSRPHLAQGGTPLAVADGGAAGRHPPERHRQGRMKERIAQLRAMGIRTIMITGDNPLTAAAIASEAGVDDFLAQASPKDKLDTSRRSRAKDAWSR
jgi:K+-transporting ATPase ATPase B chain